MKVKHLIFVFLLFIVATSSAYGWTPTDDEMAIIQAKISISMRLLKEKLSEYGYQNYFDFITREAISCNMTKMLLNPLLGEGTVAQYRWNPTTGKWLIYMAEISVSEGGAADDAVNLEYLIHELAHAGAAGTGKDDQGYDKQGEVNARKRQAESWKKAGANKPPRSTTNWMAKECWATYDVVFASTGIQRSHKFIGEQMLSYGYKKEDL